jgi:hypothetical protein
LRGVMNLSASEVNEEFTRRGVQRDAFGPNCRKFKDAVKFVRAHNFPAVIWKHLLSDFILLIRNEADDYISDIPDTRVASMGGNHRSITIQQIWAHIKEHTTGKTSNSGETGETFQKRCLIQQDRFITILRKPLDDHLADLKAKHLALTKSKVRLMTSQIGTAGRPEKGKEEDEEDFVKRLNAWKHPPQLAGDILSIIGDKIGKMSSLKAQSKKSKKSRKKKKKRKKKTKKKTRRATKKRR